MFGPAARPTATLRADSRAAQTSSSVSASGGAAAGGGARGTSTSQAKPSFVISAPSTASGGGSSPPKKPGNSSLTAIYEAGGGGGTGFLTPNALNFNAGSQTPGSVAASELIATPYMKSPRQNGQSDGSGPTSLSDVLLCDSTNCCTISSGVGQNTSEIRRSNISPTNMSSVTASGESYFITGAGGKLMLNPKARPNGLFATSGKPFCWQHFTRLMDFSKLEAPPITSQMLAES